MNALMNFYPIDLIRPLKPMRINMAKLAKKLQEPSDDIIPITLEENSKHYFANGAYVREMDVPANTIIVGRVHKEATINILLEGELELIDETGERKRVKAPLVYVAPPGNQKAAMTLTRVRWLNSFACETTDPEEALELLTCETIEEYNDYVDCKLLTAELGMTDKQMAALISIDDLVECDDDVYTSKSKLHGMGLFAGKHFNAGDEVATPRIGDNRTISGRYTNHSLTPNTRIVNGKMIASSAIKKDEEITTNYREVLEFRRLNEGLL